MTTHITFGFMILFILYYLYKLGQQFVRSSYLGQHSHQELWTQMEFPRLALACNWLYLIINHIVH